MTNLGDCPAALRQFIGTIEATGGIEQDDDGNMVPVGDREWIDLASAYMAACDALNLGYAVNRTEER